jgi:DNA-binding transcriptional ArsR family regulator
MVQIRGVLLTVPVDITDPRIAKAYAHPLRIHILGMLDDAVASPSEIASQLDAPLTHVSYHVRQLASLGLIKLVRTTPRRGAVEHHYTAQIRPTITDDAWNRTPDIVKKNLVSGWVGQLVAHVKAGAAEGGFDRANSHHTRTPMTLDDKGWLQISRELEKTLERVDKIAAEAGQRVKKNPDSGFRATAAMMLFEGPSATAGLPEDAGIRRHKRRRAKATA